MVYAVGAPFLVALNSSVIFAHTDIFPRGNLV